MGKQNISADAIRHAQRISFQIIQDSQQLSLCRVAALERLPSLRYSVVIFTFAGPF